MSKEILSPSLKTENKITSIEQYVESDGFSKLSAEAQQTARLVLVYGRQQEQDAILQKNPDNLLGMSFVWFHELGHKLAAIEVGGKNVRAKALGLGEGVTTWSHSFKNSVSRFFLERMFVSFAGRKAVEVLGFRSKGHGSDMGQIDAQSQIYESITGRSGTGLKNQAESWAESFVSGQQNRIYREGLQEAIAA